MTDKEIADRIDELRKELGMLLMQQSHSDTQDVLEQCRELKREGKIFAAVRVYRAHTGAGLKEAHDFIIGLSH